MMDMEIFLKINSILSVEVKEKLFEFLKRNMDLFAWKLEDMTGINVDIIVHELDMDHTKKPV